MSIDRFIMPQRLAVGAGVHARRRGSVLVLVMTVLGVLFVTGIAFLTTMEFEAKMVQAERQRDRMRPGMESVMDEMGGIMIALSSEDTQAFAGGALFAAADSANVPLPGVHNLYSPVEPYFDYENGLNYHYRWMTDMRWLAGRSSKVASSTVVGGVPAESAPSRTQIINTTWERGADITDPAFEDKASLTGEFMVPVDADGDGIVDAFQVLMSDIGMEGTRIDALSRVVNPSSVQSGPVYMGLRVLPHGGMANINESHPLILGFLGFDLVTHNPPYEPQQEEPSLRRRTALPPRELPPTRLQGNPIVFDSEMGNGDFSTKLFLPGETLWEHRYWPFGPDEINASIDGEKPIWAIRMEPTSSKIYGSDEYDRRHLITTVSHDDLLAKVTMEIELDATTGTPTLDPNTGKLRTFDVTKKIVADHGVDADNRFPIVDYPGTVDTYANTYSQPLAVQSLAYEWDFCINNPTACTRNPRKGRLKLSLPWLQEMLTEGIITKQEQIRLIQDGFTLMLINARGPEWGGYEGEDTDGDLIDDTWWFKRDADQWENIAKTAASLTANMIDFADADDDPTEVKLREADPSSANFGNELTSALPVFGIERQPFIIEVLVDAFEGPTTGELVFGANESFVAVELFNPYSEPLSIALDEYELRVHDKIFPIPATVMNAEQFVVLTLGDSSVGVISGESFDLDVAGNEPSNLNGSSSIGLRRFAFDAAGNLVPVLIDEFSLAGTGVGKLGDGPKSSERAVFFSGDRWKAPIPDTSTGSATHSLGEYNIYENTDLRPVEVELANSGNLDAAFPTTGSLLLLMRHANSPVGAPTAAPFTKSLKASRTVTRRVCTSIGGGPSTCDTKTQDLQQEMMIDNGRMPVFDTGVLHHVDPALDAYDTNATASPSSIDRPATTDNLPWGQLVFDYFTALPLKSAGPYGGLASLDKEMPRVDQDGMRVHGRINMNAAPWSVLAGVPRMPLASFAEPFRTRFRTALGLSPATDGDPQPLGEELARAIVAYRDGRNDFDPVSLTPLTGDYGESWRGWMEDEPKARRGMGFMSVGELANVRHGDAAAFEFQVDRGRVDLGQCTGGSVCSVAGQDCANLSPCVATGNYLDAVAMLVTLGDWLTVRSHVFTVYGVLRGEKDETIDDPDPAEKAKLQQADIDRRALRFQETIDRFPMLIAEPPNRIGNPVLAKYEDLLGD